MTHPLPGDIFKVGQVLNNTYEIDKILGRGGTGEVYRARNRITERLVAIKALNRQFSGNADYIELMKREEEMRAIQHDAVVRYTECSLSDDGHVFLVMDYVEGTPLSDVMTRRRMDERELLIVGHRVAEGLVATHAKGIIHRDLSPDNIILRQGDPARATIIDFGIAKDTAVGARTIVGSDFAGKYEYSAPEQLDGQVSPQSDLYALGATLLAAWRGETPFRGATPGEIIRRKQAALDTDGVPDMLRGIVERLTAPDPLNRPENAAELVAQIDAVLRPASEPVEKRDRKTRRKPPWALLGGVAVVAAAALVWLGGLFDELLTPPLPVADPYRLELVSADGTPPVLTGNAPDEAAVEAFRNAITNSFGAMPTGEFVLATGLPEGEWMGEAQILMDHTSVLETTQLSISDRTATLSGFAPDVTTRAAVIANIDTFATTYDWQLNTDLEAGPLVLSRAAIAEALSTVQDCGPLNVEGDTAGQFGLREPVRITGYVSDEEVRPKITEQLKPLVGDRPVTVIIQTLALGHCMVRQRLADVANDVGTLALSEGDTGERNLSGVFRVGQNPVVDFLVPEEYGDGATWAFFVDPDEKVFSVIPHALDDRVLIAERSELQDGIHRVRVLFTIEEFNEDRRQLATRVNADNLGKSELFVILSRGPLFDGRRPREESPAAVVQALDEIFAQDADKVIGYASAIVDGRQ
ncbi:serine/threonine-protein kinase [Cognatiyoonia sp. IB215446]|uniref:serine/threonine-protein kinase n=1 Tax=Cognatiyoonia sp. IB215446 TaxID=3097355 RepID=UPI002A0C1FD2|nr:serine/threonine-protein kinase [Cognatiyoonia sp. IB215446]MDX8346609.1 serine/threonine-protein kinase [Cognatiyoonia sp. IB215446]